MKINKIRPKFHFLTEIEIKMTYLVFLFSLLFFFLLSLRLWSHLEAVLLTFKIFSCTKTTNSKKNVFLLLVHLNVDTTASKWL